MLGAFGPRRATGRDRDAVKRFAISVTIEYGLAQDVPIHAVGYAQAGQELGDVIGGERQAVAQGRVEIGLGAHGVFGATQLYPAVVPTGGRAESQAFAAFVRRRA